MHFLGHRLAAPFQIGGGFIEFVEILIEARQLVFRDVYQTLDGGDVMPLAKSLQDLSYPAARATPAAAQ